MYPTNRCPTTQEKADVLLRGAPVFSKNNYDSTYFCS